MSKKLWKDKHNLGNPSSENCTAIITFPQSCFYGQSVEILRVFGIEKVECFVRLPDGTRKRLPIEWLDYEVPSKVEAPSNHMCLLSISTIREILEIVECINHQPD